VIQFAKFEPDRSQYALDASTSIINALPVADGWGPQPDLIAISSALGSECLGARYCRTTSGAYRLIAGTATGLFELNVTDYTWTTLTRLAGGAYAVPQGDRWSFHPFGQNLIATNITDDVQVLDIDSGVNFAALGGSPPKAKYCWGAGEYLVLGHLATGPNTIQTSGIGDATYWTVGQKGCDFQEFPDGEEIMGGIGSEKGAIIFQRTMIRQMIIAQAGDFSFITQIVNPNRGVIAPHSIAQIGPGQFFYYSPDGFFLGSEGRAIGAERVDRWFSSRADDQKIGRIRSVADPFNKIVWTQAEEASGTKFFIGYNWQLDRWCQSDVMLSEMAVMVTPGVSIDGLDDLYDSIDDVSEPFDSGLFTGGLPRFAAFNASNELGFFTGSARAAVLETADDEPYPGFRGHLQEGRFYTDATDFTAQVGTSDYHGGTVTWSDEITPYSTTKTCHFRKAGRLFRYRMNIPAGSTWNHAIGLAAKVRQEGQR
jgi:hypothetical protein